MSYLPVGYQEMKLKSNLADCLLHVVTIGIILTFSLGMSDSHYLAGNEKR
jgi:hypothetical protein